MRASRLFKSWHVIWVAGALVALGGVGCGVASVQEGDPGEEVRGGDPGGGTTDDIAPDFETCVASTTDAKPIYQPVDIVFTIDNTPSMLDEINEVRENMNQFSQTIMESGIDVRIVVISCLPGECDNDKWHGICIDSPLGAVGGCEGEGPFSDTNLPHFLHVSERVPSIKGLSRTIDSYEEWRTMLREGSLKHFVVVSDDNDEWSAATFNDTLLTLNPSLAGYKFHAIFSYLSKEAACAISGSDPCCTFAAPGGEGTVYRELVQMTDGVSGNLCLQDFDPVFKAVATSVVTGAKLDCIWELPAPPADAEQEIDPNKVNLEFVDGDGNAQVIGRVDSFEECSLVKNGWYYDDPFRPTKVTACPQTCKWIQEEAGAAAKINAQFGCRTKIAPLE